MRALRTLSALTAVCAFFILASCDRKTPEDMALVPPGEFLMGSDSSEPDERPMRKVSLKKAFYIDLYEVTNEKYRRFTQETGRGEPRDWMVYGYKEEKDDHPVTFVTYDDAAAYCKRAGGRLPTEEEWEKAARGADGRAYPWGNEFKRGVSNTSLTGIVGTTPVGKYPDGASPYGAFDMAGNVWEWTASDFNDKTKVVRGGSWGLTHRFATTYFRVGYNPKTTAINNLGFRCARDG